MYVQYLVDMYSTYVHVYSTELVIDFDWKICSGALTLVRATRMNSKGSGLDFRENFACAVQYIRTTRSFFHTVPTRKLKDTVQYNTYYERKP